MAWQHDASPAGSGGRVARIGVLGHQLQRHLLATSADEKRNMGLLHTFGLIAYFVQRPHKGCFLLGPHDQNHLEGLMQRA
ncbi:hypothetical protein KSX_79550 [Ktedonospora formicarum]|uniref:Uncharacterized protein n=1 Tax=Ktedonospora formicarum TaxID=2778364 RepID=A0A8J3IBU2_9CHLR|nr:hypothetical protein KSX_79550 [Ktedonospora formicarum]